MAYQQVKTTAKGNAKSTGTPGPTPPPTKETAFGRQNYGANAYGGPSSIEPGAKATSPLADALKAAQNDGENVLDTIAEKGTARQDDSITAQLRKIASNNVPDAFGMASARKRQATYPGPK